MRIAYLYQAPQPELRGDRAAPVHIYHLVRGLQQQGHEVRLFTLQGRQPVYTDDLAAYRDGQETALRPGRQDGTGSRAFLLLESGLRRMQRTLGLPYLGLFDSLHLYTSCRRELADYSILHERYNLLGLGGTWTARRTGIPLILEVNGDMLAEYDYMGRPIGRLQRLFATWATRQAFSTARVVLVPSAGLADHLAIRWGIPRAKIAVLPNAADVEAFAQAGDPAALRAELGIPDGAPTIAFVGGFYPWHGLEVLVEAFAQVRRAVPTAYLVLVGDGEVRPVVEAWVTDLGLSAAVHLTGAVCHSQVPQILALADVAVAPWRSFPWGLAPIKLFEYMAAGKAIVASRTAGVADFIQDGETGLLVEPNSPQAMAQALVQLLQDPERRARMAANARREAVDQHSWVQRSRVLADIYQSLLPQRSWQSQADEE